jgi:Rieske Fe-S protein
MSTLNRRDFVLALCATAAGCAANNNGGNTTAWTGPATFDLGPAAQLTQPIDTRWLQSGGFFLVRDTNRLYALSATCTHKACPLTTKGEGILCPCHGSRFSKEGQVQTGPATTPLPRFNISINQEGHVVVDRTKQYDEKSWQSPGASLTL